MPALYQELSIAAQTAYAEVLEQAQASEIDSLAGLIGSFQRRLIKGHEYVYFGYRDPIGGRQRRVYVGPADDRVNALIARFQQNKAPRRLAPNAQAAITLGCAGTVHKHYGVIRQLGAYGFFKAGGVLVGTHAFVAMANMWVCAGWRAVAPLMSILHMPDAMCRLPCPPTSSFRCTTH